MVQKISVILIATLIILIQTVGKEKINRKMMIFLASIIVWSSVLLIIKQLTNQEVIFFSFLEVVGNGEISQFSFIVLVAKLLFEVILSIVILSRISGDAKFKQDFWIFITAIISAQIIFTDFPNLISKVLSQTLMQELAFSFLYLIITTAFCKKTKKQDAS